MSCKVNLRLRLFGVTKSSMKVQMLELFEPNLGYDFEFMTQPCLLVSQS